MPTGAQTYEAEMDDFIQNKLPKLLDETEEDVVVPENLSTAFCVYWNKPSKRIWFTMPLKLHFFVRDYFNSHEFGYPNHLETLKFLAEIEDVVWGKNSNGMILINRSTKG